MQAVHIFFSIHEHLGFDPIFQNALSKGSKIVGFLRGGVQGGGKNWGTLRIPRQDWGTLGKIREPPPLGTPPLNNPIKKTADA